jgi:hypothetical protein
LHGMAPLQNQFIPQLKSKEWVKNHRFVDWPHFHPTENSEWPLLDDTSSASPTIKHRWYERGEGVSYAIVQHSPFCVRVTAACSGHMCTQRNNKVGENYYAQRKKMCDRGKLNPKPQLWYHARWHLLCQSNHKTQVIWKGRGGLLCYSPTTPTHPIQAGCTRPLIGRFTKSNMPTVPKS